MEDRYYSRLIKVVLAVIDFFIIGIAFRYTREFIFYDGIPGDQYTSFFLIFNLSWIIAGIINDIYKINKFSLFWSISINLLQTLVVHVLLIGIVLVSVQYFVNIEFLFIVYVIVGVLFMGSRVVYKLIWKYFEFSSFDQRQVVIMGTTHSGQALHEFFISEEQSNYQFRGFFDDDPDTNLVHPNLIRGKLSEVMDFCVREKIDEIYFALPLTNKELVAEMRKFADDNFIYFRIAPDFSGLVQDSYNVFLFNSIPVFTTRKEPLSIPLNASLKRLFDIVFSLTVILTIFPFIIPIIALAIRLDSRGPIFFKQLRPGKKNKLFDCYKFRTMQVNGNTEFQALKNDPRITRVGKFLRKSNLDELPQFVNVLLGSMSIVGPRPNMISQLEEYSRTIEKYKVRHFVTPGITGYAQVNGYRGETREPGLMEKRIEYDVKYLENWSLALDVKIIFLTVWNMVKGEKRAY
jgi:putative colanic acid biosysnthesis UDP-glucose lipid carrier transferase